jgi:hypothetical protein
MMIQMRKIRKMILSWMSSPLMSSLMKMIQKLMKMIQKLMKRWMIHQCKRLRMSWK